MSRGQRLEPMRAVRQLALYSTKHIEVRQSTRRAPDLPVELLRARQYNWLVHRPLWLRATLALWSLYFVGALLGVPGLDACPVHAGHGHVHGLASMAQMASMDAASPSASSAGSAAIPRDDQRAPAAECTCLGLCCGACAVSGPAATLAVAPAVVIRARPSQPDDRTPAPRRGAHVLPFPNGPPASALLG